MAEEVAEMFALLASPADYLIHDLLFHRIISQASGNPILAVLIETITSALYDKRRKTVERSTIRASRRRCIGRFTGRSRRGSRRKRTG